ncbi:MAG: 50S ribosomal protein L11 methyltransferase [Bacteroidota bacterium]
MNYFQLSIAIPNDETRELLIAALSEQGVEGFEEDETTLKAFVSEADYQAVVIAEILQEFGLTSKLETIEPTNWNAKWEADFEPVLINDFCTIRAHFHTIPLTTKHEVIITPKMSFGTGHHATTHLMVAQMQHIDFKDKSVFDFGTGTGVLAILAEILGASEIIAIDNDEWSFENTRENIGLNNCHNISVSMDSIESVQQTFDIILANINRHILLAYMPKMYQLLNDGGTLLMSGLLTDDELMVSDAAKAAGFTVQGVFTRNNWISILCAKS